MPLLAIVRHGQSAWNLENRFTGDMDVDLTPVGREEARTAGSKLAHIPFSRCFTSQLKRAIDTLDIILQEIHEPNLPVIRSAALNERRYGDLQGMNKAEMAEKYGQEQVDAWRRSFDIRPPGGESLQDTAGRVLPYYREHIEPFLADGENILIVAHGNSLRSLMMVLENISPGQIVHIDLPTGMPRLYTYDDRLRLKDVSYL